VCHRSYPPCLFNLRTFCRSFGTLSFLALGLANFGQMALWHQMLFDDLFVEMAECTDLKIKEGLDGLNVSIAGLI